MHKEQQQEDDMMQRSRGGKDTSYTGKDITREHVNEVKGLIHLFGEVLTPNLPRFFLLSFDL